MRNDCQFVFARCCCRRFSSACRFFLCFFSWATALPASRSSLFTGFTGAAALPFGSSALTAGTFSLFFRFLCLIYRGYCITIRIYCIVCRFFHHLMDEQAHTSNRCTDQQHFRFFHLLTLLYFYLTFDSVSRNLHSMNRFCIQSSGASVSNSFCASVCA